MYLKDNNHLKGGGRGGYNLANYPSVKFAQKDFVAIYASDKDFAAAFDEASATLFGQVIDTKNSDLPTQISSTSGSSVEEEFDD